MVLRNMRTSDTESGMLKCRVSARSNSSVVRGNLTQPWGWNVSTVHSSRLPAMCT